MCHERDDACNEQRLFCTSISGLKRRPTGRPTMSAARHYTPPPLSLSLSSKQFRLGCCCCCSCCVYILPFFLDCMFSFPFSI